jgi:hypothetical protein
MAPARTGATPHVRLPADRSDRGWWRLYLRAVLVVVLLAAAGAALTLVHYRGLSTQPPPCPADQMVCEQDDRQLAGELLTQLVGRRVALLVGLFLALPALGAWRAGFASSGRPAAIDWWRKYFRFAVVVLGSHAAGGVLTVVSYINLSPDPPPGCSGETWGCLSPRTSYGLFLGYAAQLATVVAGLLVAAPPLRVVLGFEPGRPRRDLDG